ncbi:hypothetical protein CVT24_010781 [Panaeolus cyanescens]|uniref:Uncharacterized protein n=1 Tax=Panaeolus cyanescens TaxID=181874 RepID=A0A409WEB6_9AGAR|nr:hypothetical protein CVT24_010781 [Panaeolus cyanescens]
MEMKSKFKVEARTEYRASLPTIQTNLAPTFHEWNIFTGPESDQAYKDKAFCSIDDPEDSTSDAGILDSDTEEDINEIPTCPPTTPQATRLTDSEKEKYCAPSLTDAATALKDLEKLLNPPRVKGPGHIDPHLNLFQQLEHGVHQRTRQRLECRIIQPGVPADFAGSVSMLADEDLTNDINLYLQEIGLAITSKKLTKYFNSEDMRKKHDIDKPISERTARCYLNHLGYRWSAAKKGQYADGHKREDIRVYRAAFLEKMKALQQRMEKFSKEGLPEFGPRPQGREVVIWFHNETILYTHDRRRKAWYHKDASAKPYAKGDGASLMIADFVSVKFGWLHSPDGEQNAQHVLKPGKARNGYFTNEDICEQANAAMSILCEHYPEYEHILVYNNASTHLKRGADALSARYMPKFTPKEGGNDDAGFRRQDHICT